MIHTLYRKALRLLLSIVQRARSKLWKIARPQVRGAHSFAFTPTGKLVLVKLAYAKGWHLPGGGRKVGETPEENALRELREEIGMLAHDPPRLALALEEQVDGRHDEVAIFLVENVMYRPNRWSIEIEEVMEAGLDDLPSDLSSRVRAWLAKAGLVS